MNIVEFFKLHNIIGKTDLYNVNNLTGKRTLTENAQQQLNNIIGKQYWVCAYEYTLSLYLIPIRNVQPVLVQVCSANEPYQLNCVELHLVNKNGKLSKTFISPATNKDILCGSQHSSLYIFDNKEDCVKYYNNQLNQAIEDHQSVIDIHQMEIIKLKDIQQNNLK